LKSNCVLSWGTIKNAELFHIINMFVVIGTKLLRTKLDLRVQLFSIENHTKSC